jgi:hypothetical protein
MSTRVRIPSLVNTMSTCWWEKLNMVEGSSCSYSCPTWKPTFFLMATKMLQIASWVLVCLLRWVQCKRWIPIKLIGCVHTHQGIPTIERYCNPNHVWNVVEKIRENNQKVGKINWVVNQMPIIGPKHDKILAQWALDILFESMLERVWWCKHSKMELWNQTICCSMSYSKGKMYICAKGNKRLQNTLRCY